MSRATNVIAFAALFIVACGGATTTRGGSTRSSAVIHRTARADPRRSPPAPPSPVASDAPPSDADAGAWWAAYEASAAIDTFEGRASYYADSLAGRHTANGDVYDPSERTAASRDLPFGTVLRVVRLDTGASVIVRVNDRGPFGDRRRVLDLSRSAAEALDMIRRGVADVRVEVLERP